MLCNLPCRIILIVINTATFIAGAALVIVGALMIWGKGALSGILAQFITPLLKMLNTSQDATQITELLSRVLTTTAPIGMAILCVGAACAIVSLIGYCGACCNYKIILYLYAALIGLLALAVLIIIIIYFAKRDALGDIVVNMYAKSVKAYVSLEANTVDSLIVGLLQPPLHCCGVDGPDDFKNMSKTDVYNGQNYQNLQYPIPCCMMNDKYVITGANCPQAFTNSNSYIGHPCRQPLNKQFVKYMNYVAYGLIATLGILVALIVFTIITVCVDVI
ncbi:Tetraspanin-CD63 receptor [Fasciolopsis buskii]|uniref:Tetraspanin-CD63 receptor n=1 Tax=Fasciolopsis buskii TaxID=27845 RepID=A0A8E0RRX8_9TREM|nr:Tetraspanin-CD63 receptor [Fasciolopsis buski]